MKTIAIIGAGFSGTVTALNLLRQAEALKAQINVVLIDKAASFGKGLAYATEDDNLVLNVPIGNMSAFADLPDDFLEFCHGMDSSLNHGSFVFRRIYGEYLQLRLREAKSAYTDRLIEMRDFVTGMRPSQGGLILNLQTGAQVAADCVVLAFGHFAPRALSEILGEATFHQRIDQQTYLDNPWDVAALDRLPADKDVLIVGTGHTAMDTLFRLVSSSLARKIYIVSRHGHTPNGHRKAGEFVKLAQLTKSVESTMRSLLSDRPTIRMLFSTIRKLSKQHSEQQGNWRDVINSLRQLTPEIWRALPGSERARFLRHVVYHWDVLRHRLAPVAIRRFEDLLSAGRVEIIAGRIAQFDSIAGDSTICASIRLRGSNRCREFMVGSVINCTGPNYDIHRISNPLVRQLTDAGILQQDELKTGFTVDENYRCSDLPNLHYIGPMLKASYWEAIAVPELRVHSQNLAKIILVSA